MSSNTLFPAWFSLPAVERPALTLLLLSAVLVAAPLAGAADAGALRERVEARHDADKDAAKEAYEQTQETCRKLRGDAKEVCIKDARAAYSDAKSRADAREEAGRSADEELKAYYKAERARCDQLGGAARDICINDAKVKYRQ